MTSASRGARVSPAVEFLRDAWRHQLGLFHPHPATMPVELDDLVAQGYFATLECLTGGEVLQFDDSDGVESRNTAERLFTHTDHYAVFLIELMRTLQLNGESRLARDTFALNKALHSINVWIDVEMPPHYRLAHCVGTVIGKASLGDRLFIGHGCTIGASGGGEYPTIGRGVSLRAGSSVLGQCLIGDNVVLSAGVILINTDVPPESLVLSTNGSIRVITSDYPRRFTNRVFGD